MDGSSVLVAIYDGPSGFPEGLSLDLINRNVYWTDKTLNKVFRAPMVPGSSREELYEETAGTTTLGGIDLDIEAGYMYWTDNGGAHENIKRAGLQIPDGETPSTRTDVELVVTIPGTTKLEDVILNFMDKRMYFTDTSVDIIKSADFDGSNIEELISLPSTTIRRLALIPSRGEIYWTETDTAPGKIQKCLTPFKKVYDNANVTHAIPQSSLQYTWIKDSALTTRTEFSGYATGSDIQFYSDSILFANNSIWPGHIYECSVAGVTSADTDGTEPVWMSYIFDLPTKEVRFSGTPDPADVGSTFTIGINEYIDGVLIATISTDVEVLCFGPLNSIYNDPLNATQSFDFTGSVYTYGTWKEIRGGELSLSRYYRNHNILPVTNESTDVTTQYIEPPVVAKHMPMEHVMAIDSTGTPSRVFTETNLLDIPMMQLINYITSTYQIRTPHIQN